MLKIFSHRGYLLLNNPKKLLQENSIASLKNAVANGFNAIEFDIWHINNQLILSHDLPISIEDCPRFSDYLQYQNQLEYWLDFKNLTLKNIDNTLDLIAYDLNFNKIKLNQLYFAPYCTDYSQTKIFCEKFRKYFNEKIKFVAVCDHQNQINDLEQLIIKEKIEYISIDYKLITKEIVEKFKTSHLMAWTIKDQESFAQITKLKVNYFACDILPKLF
ncbi:hypothetical protein LBMAG18_05620 [Alphaproteobacteria bacterium]|nr:hypothetical protein LBMAG18_05620 [Alphaproteobacteria bacterium]